jgi:NDP-sugar pyrophosphorylase family protein
MATIDSPSCGVGFYIAVPIPAALADLIELRRRDESSYRSSAGALPVEYRGNKLMKAVILAGGLGTRLKPFTQAIPKPLLPVGEQSLIELQIENFVSHGFREIFLCTNFKSRYIETFIGDGSQLGARVKVSKESEPLGTCGPLSLLRDELQEPFVMMNGDILTTLDLGAFYRFGSEHVADLTIATKQVRTPFNFGSVEAEGDRITSVEEKPDLVMEVVAGIYFVRPAVLDLIPDDTYFGVNHLIAEMLGRGSPLGRYRVSEYWLDIGQIDDYTQAEEAYEAHFQTRKA